MKLQIIFNQTIVKLVKCRFQNRQIYEILLKLINK